MDGVENVIEYLDSNRELTDYFTNQNVSKGCPKLLDVMNSSVSIGQGSYGNILEVTLDSKKYVVKKVPSQSYDIIKYHHPSTYHQTTLGVLSQSFLKSRKGKRFDLHNFYLVNKGEPDTIVHPNSDYYVPFRNPLVPCQLKKDFVIRKYYYIPSPTEIGNYEKADLSSVFVYPQGSYVCANNTYSEYAISSLLSERKLVNVMNVFGFSMCSSELSTYDYTFMEKVDGTVVQLPSRIKNLNEKMIESILVQGLFCISNMSRSLIIQHNDLHLSNIGYVKIDRKQKKLYNAEYFNYEIDEKCVKCVNPGFVLKILDFGLSVKYSSPIIASALTVDGNISDVVPMWRDDSYDLLSFLFDMYVVFGKTSKLVKIVFAHVLSNNNEIHRDFEPIEEIDNMINRLLPVFYKPQHPGRSTFVGVPVRAWDLLKNERLFKHSKKGMTIGRISSFHPDFHRETVKEYDSLPIHQFLERYNVLRDISISMVVKEIGNDKKLMDQYGEQLIQFNYGSFLMCMTAHTPNILNIVYDIINFIESSEYNISILRLCIVFLSRCMNCIVYTNLSHEDVTQLISKVSRVYALLPEYRNNLIRLEKVIRECIDQTILKKI